MATARHPRLGALLIAAGVVGVVTGIVPLVMNLVQPEAGGSLRAAADWAAHGIEGLGLSSEWALLSSAMGTYLGALLLWCGHGWRTGRASASLATWIYVSCGVAVNATDMFIFAFRARVGTARTLMLLADGVALLLPLALGVWLLTERRRQ